VERKIVKSKSFLTITLMNVVQALAMPVRGAAQDQEKQANFSVLGYSSLGGYETPRMRYQQRRLGD
jgi:hypothetical protein